MVYVRSGRELVGVFQFQTCGGLDDGSGSSAEAHVSLTANNSFVVHGSKALHAVVLAAAVDGLLVLALAGRAQRLEQVVLARAYQRVI